MRTKKTRTRTNGNKNAKDIETALKLYYEAGARYLVPNIYFFGHGYGETDLLVVKEGKKNLIYDIEIKVSKADFKADFKKLIKHEVIEHGSITVSHRRSVRLPNGKRKMARPNEPIPVEERPNRFYFAVPEGLISLEDVPDYAGLLYVNEYGTITKIKEAKLLHKNEVPHESKLCRKFYFYWLNQLNSKKC